MEIGELIELFPTFYHMAQGESWLSIEKHGLLSTTELLNLYEYEGDKRSRIESEHRRESISIHHVSHGTAVVRDQKPMNEAGLAKCLQDGLTPQEWYEILNSKTFFWTSEDRLGRLLNAGAYKKEAHDVLIIESRRLIEKYHERILLSAMNSGGPTQYGHPRGLNTFLPIKEYPFAIWRKKRKKGDGVVEVVIEGGVPDIKDYVIRVEKRCGNETLGVIWER